MADPMTEDLNALNACIAKLQVAYEQYFSGGIKHEPLDLIKEAEAYIKKYAVNTGQNPGVYFRYNSLVARYNSFKKVWERRKRLFEGTDTPVKAWGIANPRTPAPRRSQPPAAAPPKASPPPAPAPGGFSVVISGSAMTPQQAKQIFDQYVAVRSRLNEPTANLRVENFQAALADQLNRIRSKSGEGSSVVLKIDVKDNKSRITAKPSSDR
jgi:hypothetical protein